VNAQSSIFLTITPLYRVLIIGYFFLYRVFFPGIGAILSPYFGDEVWALFAAEMLYTFLLVFPLLFYSPRYGWLHPLILPSLLTIAFEVIKNPAHLVLPFAQPLVSFVVETTSPAVSLALGYDDLARLRLHHKLIYSASLLAYYFGFFTFRRHKIPRFQFREPRALTFWCLAGIGASAGATAAFIAYFGGLSGLITAMRGGRATAFSGFGPVLDIGEFGMVIALIWFVYAKRAFLNPLFLGGLALSSLSALLVTGARSSLIAPLITLVLLWWWKSGRVLIGPSLGLALAALAVFGAWGAIRQDYDNTQVDWSVLDFENMESWFGGATLEIEKRRNEEGDLAAFAGAQEKGLLFGRTYIGSVLFFVPRALWEDKPRSVDTYNMFINFVGGEVDQELPKSGVWGIPVGPVTEAFWNFHLPGVIVIFAAFGVFHRWLSEFISTYRNVPAMWVVYVYVLSNFAGSGLSFVSTIRDLVFLIGFLMLLGVVRTPGPRRR